MSYSVQISDVFENWAIQKEGWWDLKDIYSLHWHCMGMLSHMWLFATLWTVARQGSLSMGFSRQEYWSELPFVLKETFLTQGLNLHLLHLLHWQVGSLPLALHGNPRYKPISPREFSKNYLFGNDTKIFSRIKLFHEEKKILITPTLFTKFALSILTAMVQLGRKEGRKEQWKERITILPSLSKRQG